MKTNFLLQLTEKKLKLNTTIKKLFFLGGLSFIMLSFLSFTTLKSIDEVGLLPEKHKLKVEEGFQVSQDNEFIYIIAFNSSNSQSVYSSEIINYDGNNTCGMNRQELFEDAGKNFIKYLVTEYGSNERYWSILYKGASGDKTYIDWNFKGFDTKAKTQNAKETYARSITNSNNEIYDTGFTYKCNMGYSQKTQPTQSNTVGKAYWVSYYVKNSTVYVTKVYNNNCNHCQNEISEAFVKWLILNDYDRYASTVYVINMHDVNESALEDRRTEAIIRYKQQGYSVINVGFTYTQK